MKSLFYTLFLAGLCYSSNIDKADALLDSLYNSAPATQAWADSISKQYTELFSEYQLDRATQVIKSRYMFKYNSLDSSSARLTELSGGEYPIALQELLYESDECRKTLIFWIKYAETHKDISATVPFYAQIRCIEAKYDSLTVHR